MMLVLFMEATGCRAVLEMTKVVDKENQERKKTSPPL